MQMGYEKSKIRKSIVSDAACLVAGATLSLMIAINLVFAFFEF